MKRALIIVDYQNDFILEDGRLSIGTVGIKIEDKILKRAEEYLEKGDTVIFTLDTHTKNIWEEHPESSNFNIHCEKGTEGHKIYGKLERISQKPNTLMFEKNAFSLENKDLEQIIRNFDSIELSGVVTDICVLQIGISLYNTAVNLNKKVLFYINEESCASFDIKGHEFALEYMKKNLGFKKI